MTACLEAIAAWVSGGAADIDTLPWASLRLRHTTAIRAALAGTVSQGRYAPATANKHLAALRGALKAAWRLGMMDTDDYLRAVDLRPISGSRLPAGRDIEQAELAALLAQCQGNDSPAGVRDAAVIGLAYLSGTRRGELAALCVGDVEVDPPAIRVVGKGGKERLVPLSPPWDRSSRPGWRCGATALARCSAPSTGPATSAGTGASPARRCASSSHAVPWPPALPRSRPMTFAAATPATSSTPAPTCRRSSS